jgi:hypothetical protein
MSANRSVQAAQRRRAAPTNEPSMPGRGPQPSINSAQMFANQARPGSGPNIPPGRIAGQQAIKQNQGQQNDKLSSVSKMTISQAITLITLRLGAVESKLMHPSMESGVTDPEFFQSIMTRLDDLEKDNSSNTGSSNSGADVTLLTQQMELLKQSVMQIKNTTLTLAKENVSLKSQIENLKKELTTLQNVSTFNTEQIIEIKTELNRLESNSMEELNYVDDVALYNESNEPSNELSNESAEIMETNLKLAIENELNNSL